MIISGGRGIGGESSDGGVFYVSVVGACLCIGIVRRQASYLFSVFSTPVFRGADARWYDQVSNDISMIVEVQWGNIGSFAFLCSLTVCRLVV